MNNPCKTAKEIAAILDSDPIMASQIKEYIKPERVLDFLEISDDEIVQYAKRNGLIPSYLEHASDHDLLDEVRNRM